jgi:hypothetical protein
MRTIREVLDMTVEELLAEDPAAAVILGGYRIDLCRCHPLALRAAARVAGADADAVATALVQSACGAADGRSEREPELVRA